jgi:hypothetical protein
MLREATRNGEELRDFALGVWRDESNPMHLRWKAFEWIGLRQLGQPTVQVNANVTAQNRALGPESGLLNFGDMTPDEIGVFLTVANRFEAELEAQPEAEAELALPAGAP